jgi:mono/diheme cytochrome c family protein
MGASARSTDVRDGDMSAPRVITFCCALLLAATQGVARQPQREPAAAGPSLLADADIPKGDVEHGRYIVERVVMCAQCHSTRDEDGNIIPERRFMGGPIPFKPPWPNDWAFRAPRNAGLPGYTDAQAIRLLTQGAIDRNGRQLRPPMPRFRMTVQDAADVVAYMRTIK